MKHIAAALVICASLIAVHASAAESFPVALDKALNNYCSRIAFEKAKTKDFADALKADGYGNIGIEWQRTEGWQISVSDSPFGPECTLLVSPQGADTSQVLGILKIYVAGSPVKMTMTQNAKKDEDGNPVTIWTGGGRKITYKQNPKGSYPATAIFVEGK